MTPTIKTFSLLALAIITFGLTVGCSCVTDECLCEMGDTALCK